MNAEILQQFDKFSPEEKDEVQRQLCKTNLKYLCTKILGYPDWDICHDEVQKFLSESKKSKKLILLPREHLKTSIITIGTSIQHILNDFDTTILYANAIQSNAESFLRETKN